MKFDFGALLARSVVKHVNYNKEINRDLKILDNNLNYL